MNLNWYACSWSGLVKCICCCFCSQRDLFSTANDIQIKVVMCSRLTTGRFGISRVCRVYEGGNLLLFRQSTNYQLGYKFVTRQSNPVLKSSHPRGNWRWGGRFILAWAKTDRKVNLIKSDKLNPWRLVTTAANNKAYQLLCGCTYHENNVFSKNHHNNFVLSSGS